MRWKTKILLTKARTTFFFAAKQKLVRRYTERDCHRFLFVPHCCCPRRLIGVILLILSGSLALTLDVGVGFRCGEKIWGGCNDGAVATNLVPPPSPHANG